jgi:hypothetical protein
VQHRESNILASWGLLTIGALVSVVLFNDWKPLGLWIIFPQCGDGLFHEHIFLDADGQWRSYAHTHFHSSAHVQAEVSPEATADFLFDYVIAARDFATSYSGWRPPACD